MKTDFRDVKRDIRQRILNGTWGPGSLIPNEVELTETFNCARATVNRAMRELAEEGLIERKRKAGTRVRLSPLRSARFEIPIVRKEIESRGQKYRYSLINRKAERAPDGLRARMDLSEGAEVLHLTCMHYSDGNPYQYEDRWINLTALPQAMEADFSQVGPNEWLVAEMPFSDAEISFSAVNADDQLAQLLDCTAGDALFMAERMTWWDGQVLTYVRLTFQRGHRITTRF